MFDEYMYLYYYKGEWYFGDLKIFFLLHNCNRVNPVTCLGTKHKLLLNTSTLDITKEMYYKGNTNLGEWNCS